MSVLTPGGGFPDEDRRPGAGRVGTVVLVLLLMLVVGGAAYGIGTFLGNRTSDPSASPGPGGTRTPGTGSPSPTTSATPCVTTTVVASQGLPKPATVTVNVYNATDRVGLARRTADTLKGRGFVIGTVANDPKGKQISGVAEIRHGAKGAAAARLMLFYVPGATLVRDDRTDATIDVVLGQEFKTIPAQATVDSNLNKPRPSPGPGCARPTPSP